MNKEMLVLVRKAIGLTTKDFARAIGVSYDSMRHMACGSRVVTIETSEKVNDLADEWLGFIDQGVIPDNPVLQAQARLVSDMRDQLP